MTEILKLKPTEKQLRLSCLSGRALDYITLGDLVRQAPTKEMKQALSVTQLQILKKLNPFEIAQVAEYGKWQQERIRRDGNQELD